MNHAYAGLVLGQMVIHGGKGSHVNVQKLFNAAECGLCQESATPGVDGIVNVAAVSHSP
jgi:hypothetical protein